MSIERWDCLAGCDIEPRPDGYYVTFEDHERELAVVKLNLKRCQDEGADIWGELARRTGLELDAHKAMSKKVIMQLGASMQAASERMTRLVDAQVAYDELRVAVGAIPTTTLRFWLATRHIEGFDPATEFCRLALKMRGEQ